MITKNRERRWKMLIVKCEQYSDQYWEEKIGKPSASNGSKIITTEGKPSKQKEGYLFTLAAERITKTRDETFKSSAMEVGSEREEMSRQAFEYEYDVKVEQVGLVYKDKEKDCLCSPDGIVKGNEGLELKNVLPKTQVKYLLKNKLPTEYFVQIQFSLYVTGFKIWHFYSYVPKMRPLHIVVERDEEFIKKLGKELKLFNKELEAITAKIRG